MSLNYIKIINSRKKNGEVFCNTCERILQEYNALSEEEKDRLSEASLEIYCAALDGILRFPLDQRKILFPDIADLQKFKTLKFLIDWESGGF